MKDNDPPFGDEDDDVFMDPMAMVDWMPGLEILQRRGFTPLPPEEIPDEHLRGRLWELIYGLAGRRIYLHDTNHLSDRELYEWIFHVWLTGVHADIDPKHEWNTRVSPLDTQLDDDLNVWLRYYADEEDRQLYLKDGMVEQLPLHEDPAHDRDRWLPDTPEIVELPEFEVPDDFDLDDDEEDEGDPLGLKEVDREIAKERPKPESESKPVEMPPWKTPGRVLHNAGVVLLPPDELDDESVAPKLWELLHELACRGFFVLNSDHFSDAELYRKLWKDSLREPAMLPGRSKTGGWFHDFVGSGSDEDDAIYVRYYATDDIRAYRAKQYPHGVLPPREKPPFNRDWRTPKGPMH